MDERPNPLEIAADDVITCPACGAMIGGGETFCPACNAPISMRATTDPVQQIYAQGDLYRKLPDARPRLAILIGAWILCFPPLIAAVIGIYAVVIDRFGKNPSGLISAFVFWGCLLTAVFCAVILYRVTTKFITFQLKKRHLID
jgi:hypothetical protein